MSPPQVDISPRGSSPRVRGKPMTWPHFATFFGLIPACAGKTLIGDGRANDGEAHPRVCGENTFSAVHGEHPHGSSPRVRGKQIGEFSGAGLVRLIPACAGKTTNAIRCPLLGWAHPRVCGENTERSGVLTLRSVRSWKTLSFPSSLKVTHCRAFVQLSLSRIRL